ncbi:efflux RND transporter periplasmic adaptor subunit [Lentisphaera profundi]|uniref:Efflux RND transporter periplasmic adaptor subunit n=1 Tax=Lentisphaera profundi TaxID=1658616 RepID=A0ABY7VV15_9BACT|nr:efflux RND transporter periplasmic adaptor subunit [Lentisphaera profundi]WDE97552.1 efflux RND transporter periplasmic adaptor subunit [Lentisphaera profundi]
MKSLFENDTPTDIKAPKRRFLYIIPLFLLIIIAGFLFTAGKDKFFPPPQYDIARARLAESGTSVQSGQTLFQAAGWVHASPYPIRATALVSGVVDEIFVKGGDKVEKGQVLASLNTEDLELKLLEAKSKHQELKLNSAQYLLAIEVLKAKIKENHSLTETAQAVATTAKNRFERLKQSGPGVSKFTQEQAELEHLEELSKIKQFNFKNEVIEAQIKQSHHQISIAESQVAIQDIKIKKIKLDLSRSEIKAPANGIIQKMYARVGRKQMLSSDNEVSTTVAEIFDPTQILIKVDVPLNELNKVQIGQDAKVNLESIKETLTGKVIAIEGEADYQKNTLEVQVGITGGHPNLRPQMLAQVEFISSHKAQKIESKESVFIHRECLLNNSLYLIDLEGRIKIQKVQLGERKNGEWQEISSGLQAGQKAIYQPSNELKNGLSIKTGRIYE